MSNRVTPEEPAKKSPRGGEGQPVIAPAAQAAARALYEGNPGATVYSVAEETGINPSTIKRWKVADTAAGRPWLPCARTITDLPGRAAELANTFKTRMADLGKPMSDEVAAAEVAKEISVTHAVDVRANVLDRHRKEWNPVRALAYDCIKLATGPKADVAKAYEKAKLAKIMGETLQIIQVGECRAFGLDHTARGADGGTVVVIEREVPGAAPTTAQMGPPAELQELGTQIPHQTDAGPVPGVPDEPGAPADDADEDEF
jgi:transposase-like protein